MATDDAVRAALEQLRGLLGDSEPAQLTTGEARTVVDKAWEALGSALGERPTEGSSELLTALRTMHASDTALLQQRVTAGEQTLRRMASTFSQLEQAAISVAAVVEVAPRLLCELGFDRAIVSQVQQGIWIPEAVYVTGDEVWAAQIEQAGRTTPQPLVPGLFETEVVRRREAIAVYDVQTESRVNRPIADESQSRSYVAAPVLSRGKVVGFVHGDHFFKGREVDEYDRELIVAFSEALRLAVSRATLAERLQRAEDGLKALTSSLVGAVRGTDGPLVIQRHGIDDDVSATAPRPALPWSGETPVGLSRDLTRREVEVLALLAEGRTNAGIAKELVISEATVKQHVKHVLRKVGAANRSEAVAIWFQSAGNRL